MNGRNELIFGVETLHRPGNKVTVSDFASFEFSEKYDTFYESKCHFLVKIPRNRKKMHFWLIKGVIFLQKLKISKIWNRNFVAGPMKSLYTKNQLIPTFRLWLLFFLRRKSSSEIATRKSEKIAVFWPKIGQFSKFFKNQLGSVSYTHLTLPTILRV